MSPDLSRVVFICPTATLNVSNLYRPPGWQRDSGVFGSWQGGRRTCHLPSARRSHEPANGRPDGWRRTLAHGTDLGGSLRRICLLSAPRHPNVKRVARGIAVPLASPAGDFIDYDFAYD
jgi:hypothetical protein